jgi:hypothetical protein
MTILAIPFGPGDHNEVAQRMWRHRNYERLEKAFPESQTFCSHLAL